jgi:FkbM family methyltransferase
MSFSHRFPRIAHWSQELLTYSSEAGGLRDFINLMRVRLSQSKVGPVVTPHPIEVDVNLRTLGPPVRLRSHTTDISVLTEILVGHSYEHLPNGDTKVDAVVDLGSNIGLSFRWLRARYPGARFVCVEPDPGNLAVLRANVRSVDPEAAVIGKCIGGRERTVGLASGDGEWGYRMTEEGGGEIGVTTMEALIEGTGIERIGVLKCDVEGAEAELFADCRSWIDRVDAMCVECHLDVISADALLATLADNGASFDVRHLERNPDMGFELLTLERARG